MARSSHEVKIRLTAKDEASREIEKARKGFAGLTDTIKKNFAAAAIAATAAIYGLSRAFGSWIGSMLEAEKADTALRTALKKTGDATRENIAAFKAQGEAIQESTRFTQDAVTKTQAFLSQLGVSSEQLKLATQASVDLSEAFGISLESAARNVGRTIGGFAGELGELIPELKTLDAEALKAGEGIRLLAEKFKGTATAAADTLEVALKQLNNELSDMGKAFAIGAAGGKDFKDSVKKVTDVIRDFKDEVELAGKVLAFLVSIPMKSAELQGRLVGGVLGKILTPSIVEVAAGSEEMAEQLLASVEAMQKSKEAAQFEKEVLAALAVSTEKASLSAKALKESKTEVVEETQELKEKVEEEVSTLRQSVDAYESAARGADSYAASVYGAAQAVEVLNEVEAQSNTGSNFGGTTSGGSKLFPNSAVANTAIRNGVAVDVRGQGFRS